MSNLSIFQFESQEIRFVEIDGIPYVVGIDVAKALGYADPSKTISTKVNKEYTCVTKTVIQGQNRDVTCVSEAGIYQLIFGSKLESAERFRRWVFEDVLPTIRQTGSYQLSKPQPTPDEIVKQGCWAVDLILAGVNVRPELVSQIKANLVAKHLPAISSTVEETRQLLINESASDDNLLTPTQLGKRIGMSGTAVNKKLLELGLQVRHPKKGKTDPAYIATPSGTQYSSVVFATDNKNNSQTTYQSLRWNPSVIDLF